MSSAVNLRIDPRTGVSNWVGPITEGNGDAEFDVAEFPELPGVYGVILTQRPHPTDIEVYLTSDPSNPLTRVRKVTEPASDEFWSDSDQRNPRGYIIVNSSLVGQNLTIVYKAGGYLAHKRVLETVIPEGPPGPAGGVDSVFGRSGNVTAQSGDYNLDQISDGATNKAFTATEKTKLAGIGSGSNVSSVFGRSGAITAQAADYAAFYAKFTAPTLVTPIFTGLGTVSGVTCYTWRIGPLLYFEYAFTSGISMATEARASLRYNDGTGEVDVTAASNYPALQVIGSGASDSGVSAYVALIEASNAYMCFGVQDGSGGSRAGLSKRNADSIFANGWKSSFSGFVRIQGW